MSLFDPPAHPRPRRPPARSGARRARPVPRDPAAPGSPWRAVAVVVAVALACAGVVSADRAGFPRVVGAAAGASAALLGVLALPSFPTRRITVGLLAFGGLAIARHAALPGVDVGVLVVWALATLLALLLVDRAQADETPAMSASAPVAGRWVEAVRAGALLAAVAFVAVVALAPTIAQAVRRDVSSGEAPTGDDLRSSPASLRAGERLDMTSRPRLSNAVVFTVDADRPDFWRGETWDVWDGTAWKRSEPGFVTLRHDGRRVAIPVASDDVAAQRGRPMRQTFHMEAPYTNVVFAAPTAVEVETSELVLGRPDGTMAVVGGFGRGATYSVVSRRAFATEETLRAADDQPVPGTVLERYAVPTVVTDRVAQLAQRITAGAPTTYDKVRAIERWLAANTKYSLDAPLSPAGEDVVDHFVFETRLGWCEQVASTLVVMLRSVGVPARVATGFVTGDRNPLTGRYVVRERDAHAWAEVYFAGVGWQGFDPTASVPLAGEARKEGSWLERARTALPWLAGVALLAASGAFLVAMLVRRVRGRAARPRPSWGAAMLQRLERLGRRSGVARDAAQTVREYARSVAVRLGEPQVAAVGALIDTDAFSARPVAANERADAERALARIEAAERERRSRRRRPRVVRSVDNPPTVKGIP
jgi:transglutaminase-like putative cysteine protease